MESMAQRALQAAQLHARAGFPLFVALTTADTRGTHEIQVDLPKFRKERGTTWRPSPGTGGP